jgi:hypothetical protein
MSNKSIAKSLRAAKKNLVTELHECVLEKSKYRVPFSCHAIEFGTGDYKALGYYESIFQFGDSNFEYSSWSWDKIGSGYKYLDTQKAYTARIIALELAALLAEEGQDFSN